MDSTSRVFLYLWRLTCWLYTGMALAFPHESLVRELIDESSYSTAKTHLTGLITKGALTPTDETPILWLLGVCNVSLGDSEQAEKAFGKLLHLSPDFYVDPDTSPKILASFNKARERFISMHKTHANYRVAISSQVINETELVLTLDLGSTIKDATKKIRVQYRTLEQPIFWTKTFEHSLHEQNTLRIPQPLTHERNTSIAYFVEFISRHNQVFFSLGSPFSPSTIAAPSGPLRFEKMEEAKSSFAHLKTGWPMLFAALLVAAGTLTYGLLKLNN